MSSVFGRLTGKNKSHTTGNGNGSALGHYGSGGSNNNASSLDLINVGSSNTSNPAEDRDPRGKLQSASTFNLLSHTLTHSSTHRRDSSILSLTTANLADLGANVKRSVSLRSHRTNPSSSSSFAQKTRSPGGGNTNNFTPLSSSSAFESGDEAHFTSPRKKENKEKEAIAGAQKESALLRRKISLSAKGLSHKFKSTEALPALNNPQFLDTTSIKSPPLPTSEASMLVGAAPGPPPASRNGSGGTPDLSGLRPGLGIHSQSSFTTRDISSSHGGPNGAPLSHAPSAPSSMGGPMNPKTIYTQIQETSAKRMATMEYLRKVHEGDVFYFSTMHYSQATLSSMPSMYPHKLGRRAQNYFILGLSLPALLDLNAGNPLEYLKALSSLLQEFETYQTLSGYDSSGNSLSRGRMGAMFKSGMGLGGRGTKGRRSSTATDMAGGSLDPRQADLLGMPVAGRSPSEATSPSDMSSPINPTGHEFSFLLTPHIPFDPDFGTTLSTLCDTLIDTYAKLTDLVSGPDACTASVGSEFAKADKAIRKILVANVVREFEDTTRAGVKGEIAGLGKLVLGGLM